MTINDTSLYGIPRPKKHSGKEISSSTTLSFTTQLTSLISSNPGTKPGTKPTSRSLNRDIFATSNKNTRKRALADLAADADDDDGHNSRVFVQKHSEKSEAVDAATWRRTQRKMEEKARLYAALKRGDVEDGEEKHLVDFDRKWTEKEEDGGDAASSSGDEGEDDEGINEEDAKQDLVEYVDEFGRTRTARASVAAREKRRLAGLASDAPDRFTARPVAPTAIIHGDTIQAEAFDIDANTAASMRMAELAAKREAGHDDLSGLPPPADTHFDASREVRTKGVGFFQFSGDEGTRREQMEALEREREETEKRRVEVERRKEERRKMLEERRRAVGEKRSRAQADRFLEGLGEEIFGGEGGKDEEEEETVKEKEKDG